MKTGIIRAFFFALSIFLILFLTLSKNTAKAGEALAGAEIYIELDDGTTIKLNDANSQTFKLTTLKNVAAKHTIVSVKVNLEKATFRSASGNTIKIIDRATSMPGIDDKYTFTIMIDKMEIKSCTVNIKYSEFKSIPPIIRTVDCFKGVIIPGGAQTLQASPSINIYGINDEGIK